MTGQQIYEMASSFLYEADGEDNDSKKFSVSFINVLLQESLDIENSMREFKGLPQLEEAPFITSLSEEIPYSPALMRVAFPYGVASFFWQEAMDTMQAENYRNKYLSALDEAAKMIYAKAVM